ncbi:hypothetical protein CEXT_348721 [Caerostris extrusa]|uniref:Secreted protein n=1 Tax=Caerostris extrusa TaxID=172846 RepID=A0AAV4XQH4_CAEEX|nr:hypothetical protein CEXT_348721 [Caerostris extrusa]
MHILSFDILRVYFFKGHGIYIFCLSFFLYTSENSFTNALGQVFNFISWRQLGSRTVELANKTTERAPKFRKKGEGFSRGSTSPATIFIDLHHLAFPDATERGGSLFGISHVSGYKEPCRQHGS